MVVSYPHFYTGGVAKDQFVTGLKPDRLKHNSYAVVEPVSLVIWPHQWQGCDSNL